MLKQCDNVKVVTCRDKTQHVYNFQLNFAAPITFKGLYSGATPLLLRHSHSKLHAQQNCCFHPKFGHKPSPSKSVCYLKFSYTNLCLLSSERGWFCVSWAQ